MACRLDALLPVRPTSLAVGASPSRFISNRRTPALRSGLRYLAYPACTGATSVAARELVSTEMRTPFRRRDTSASVPSTEGTK